MSPNDAPPTNRMPPAIFAVEMIYLLSLMAVFVVYRTDHAFRAAVPTTLGPLPMSVVWFGAIGAVMAGLFGVYFHSTKWDHSYDYWHYSRPFVGAVIGGIGALLYYVTITLGDKTAVKPNVITFEVVAFLLAFADRAFQNLIRKVTKLLFGPGDPDTPAAGKK